MAQQMMNGSVQKWMTHKGYGFIDYGENQSVFVHMNDLNDGRQTLNISELVTFEIIMDQNSGKTRAINVSGDGSGTAPPPRRQFNNNYGGGNSGGYGGNSSYGGNRGSGGYDGGNSRFGGGFGGSSGGYGGNSRGGGWQNSNSGGGFGGNQQRGICRNFQNTGSCRFGDRCRYLHESGSGSNQMQM